MYPISVRFWDRATCHSEGDSLIRIAEDRRHSRDDEARKDHKAQAYDDAIQPKYEPKYGDTNANRFDDNTGVHLQMISDSSQRS